MSYDQKDRSVREARPIECYEFVSPQKTWRYTSHQEEVTVAGELYEPLPVTRTAIDVGSIIDDLMTMDFNIPASHEIAKIFCYTQNSTTLTVVVRSVQEGDDFATDYKVEWNGEMTGSAPVGDWAVIKTASKLQTRLNGSLSSVYYQKTCNHDLFDERCKVVREDFTESATVVKVQGQIITVDDMGFGNDALIGGKMRNTRTGEEQGLISNLANVLKIGYRFFDIVVGDTVELTLGCDHQRLGHCKNRFNNVPNYGGFDFVPEKNPFEQLNLQSTTSTTTKIRQNQSFNLSIPSGNTV